jgi:hypothetical protein
MSNVTRVLAILAPLLTGAATLAQGSSPGTGASPVPMVVIPTCENNAACKEAPKSFTYDLPCGGTVTFTIIPGGGTGR